MEVRFASNRLERCADDYREAVQDWGAPVARRYIARVRMLRDAAAFRDLWSNRSLVCILCQVSGKGNTRSTLPIGGGR